MPRGRVPSPRARMSNAARYETVHNERYACATLWEGQNLCFLELPLTEYYYCMITPQVVIVVSVVGSIVRKPLQTLQRISDQPIQERCGVFSTPANRGRSGCVESPPLSWPRSQGSPGFPSGNTPATPPPPPVEQYFLQLHA